jgi:OOP family OmpA-OmpF porin
MRNKPCIALVLMAVASSAWPADRHKWYVGLDVGQSNLDGGNLLQDFQNVDDRSNSYALRVGYRFIPWLALEGGYTDIGDFSGDLVYFCPAVVGVTCPATHQATALRGLAVNVIGIWPVAEHFELHASLGALYRELSVSMSDGVYPATHWTEKDTVASLGLGIAIPVNPRFEIALDFVQYRDIGLALDMNSEATVVNDGEASVTSLGLRWKF